MKRKFLILSVLAILVAILAANTLAYFTADTKAHNVITSGGVNIVLNEWANEDRTEPFEDRTGVMPGTEVTKIVEISNTGTAPVWVRAQVQLDVYGADEETLPPEYVSLDFNETDWTYLDGYYYYNRALAPGETTVPALHHGNVCPGDGQRVPELHGVCGSECGRGAGGQQRHGRVLRRRLAELCSAGADAGAGADTSSDSRSGKSLRRS